MTSARTSPASDLLGVGHDALAGLMRGRLHEAFADLASDDDRPYGMSIAEANLAMLDGVIMAAADFAHHAMTPDPDRRHLAVDWILRRLLSQLEARTTEGEA